MRAIFQVSFLVVIFGALLLVGCGRNDSSAAAAAAGPQALPVKVLKAQAESVGQFTEYVSTLKSRNSSVLQPEVEGQITQIFVSSGERVEPGSAILEIDQRKQQATVHSQEATLHSKVANLDWARKELQRNRELAAAGVVSKQQLDQAQTQYDSAQADVNALEATVREQNVQLRYYTVKAASIGVIGDIPVRVGDRVATNTVLTTIDKSGALEAYIYIPSEKAGTVKLGTPVQIVDDTGKLLVDSKISFISPRIDPQTQLLLAKADVQNSDHRFRNDQLVHARVVYQKIDKPLIPVTAISRQAGQTFAFVAESDGKQTVAKQKPVQLGDIVGNNYVILEGIKPGEQIITSGVQMLADGMPVTPQS
jgi:RND family efflux transporter MFP subunit